MWRLRRSIASFIPPIIRNEAAAGAAAANNNNNNPFLTPSNLLSQRTSARFLLDIHQMFNKSAIEKERARLKDEMNRGYFDDWFELEKHGGKIAMANKILIPALAADKFPEIEVNYSGGTRIKLPVCLNGNEAVAHESDIPSASLVCLAFRARSQAMIDSWTVPFLDAYNDSGSIHVYQVSFIDSWLLSLSPIKLFLLKMMKKPKPNQKDVLQMRNVYSFGDNYDFKKELKIMNLLTGYIFLLDNFGRIRWQGFGLATQEELSSLLFCTSLLLEEK